MMSDEHHLSIYCKDDEVGGEEKFGEKPKGQHSRVSWSTATAENSYREKRIAVCKHKTPNPGNRPQVRRIVLMYTCSMHDGYNLSQER